MMTKIDVIENFIKQFRNFGPDVVDCFSNGMCFHFATILFTRFEGSIVYDPIDNHFAFRADGRIYDITGDITDKPHKWKDWASYIYEDPLHTDHIRRDCIWKVPSDVVLCEFCTHSFGDDWGDLICSKDMKPVLGDHTCEKGENR